MLALRMMHTDDAPNAGAETTACQLELCLQRTIISAVLRHTDNDSGTSCADVTLQLLQPGKMERTLKKLTEDGFTEGPANSNEILVRDGQQFTVRFRGNICCDDGRTVSAPHEQCTLTHHLLTYLLTYLLYDKRNASLRFVIYIICCNSLYLSIFRKM